MKVRIGVNNDYEIYFEDIERPGQLNSCGRKIELKDLIGKIITYVEESELVEGAIILTLE